MRFQKNSSLWRRKGELRGWVEMLGLLHRSCIVAEGQRGAGDDWYLAWETGGMTDSCEGPGMVTMLGGQLVNLLLKSGFWSHSTVGSSSLICRIATTYHHQCQFSVCVCVCVCVVGSCVRVSKMSVFRKEKLLVVCFGWFCRAICTNHLEWCVELQMIYYLQR